MSETVTYSVPDVSCAHCQSAITSKVQEVAGVESVEVDLETKTVTVMAERLDETAIIGAIDDAGYRAAV